MVIACLVPDAVPPFYGSLVALVKKPWRVHPIALCCTLRRFVAKIAGVEDMAELLNPRQLSYETRGGAEVTVHATRQYL